MTSVFIFLIWLFFQNFWWSHDSYNKGICRWKNKKIMSENSWFEGCFTEISFASSEGNHLSYSQNDYFFKILWWSHQPHNKGICRWKNKMISECFTINNHRFSFVSFSTDRTLKWQINSHDCGYKCLRNEYTRDAYTVSLVPW